MSSPTADHQLRDLFSEAYERRVTAKADTDRVDTLLLRAEDLAKKNEPWQLRLLVERSHHRSRRAGIADVGALTHVRAALDALGPEVDPVLTALTTWEASRYDLVPDEVAENVLNLAERIEATFPYVDRWGVPTDDVVGYLRLLLADQYRHLGAYEEQLRCLRAIVDGSYCADREVGKAYRRIISTLRRHLDLEGSERVVEEFRAREPTLDAHGRAHFARMMALRAEAQSRWREGVRFREAAWGLSPNPISKGNIANEIAYCYCRLGDPDGIVHWTDRAEQSWSVLGVARVGRLVSARYRAVAASMRGDWSGAFALCAAALGTTTAQGILTWAALVEIASEAARAGAGPSHLAGLEMRTGEGTHLRGSDLDAMAAHVLAFDHGDGSRSPDARLAVALATLVAEGWIRPPAGLRDRLEDVQGWLIDRHSWWRAGACSMALADLDRNEGNLHQAAVRIEQGFDLWRRHQGRASGEDHPWLVTYERRRFLDGWSIAASTGDHRLAAKIAEAARGTALAAMLSDPSLQGSAIAAELERRAGAGAILDAPDDEVLAGDEDESGGETTEQERATLKVRARAVLGSLDSSMQTIWRMLGSVETGAYGRLPHGWTVWIDIQDEELLLAALGPDDVPWSSTETLSERVAQHVRQLADPRAAQAKVSSDLAEGLASALEALGRALEGGPMGAALAAATVDAPLELRISPGGLAWAVPWAAVRVWGDVLIRRAAITLVPSEAVASVLDGLTPDTVDDPVVVFDPKLLGTRLEHASLAECWPTVRDLDFGLGEAQPVGPCGMFVASVHGDYGEGGLRQGLLLPGRRVDGVELFTWTFPRLTVFGACWVGRVDPTSSGEALGLVFPVLARGARTVVGGMFGIHDEETGRILADLYQLVASGAGAAGALRAAQLKALERCGPQAPLNRWAGLCAIGVH